MPLTFLNSWHPYRGGSDPRFSLTLSRWDPGTKPTNQKQTPGLQAVLAPTRNLTKSSTVKVAPERDGHGEPPAFAIWDQTRPTSNSPRVMPSETWYDSIGGFVGPEASDAFVSMGRIVG